MDPSLFMQGDKLDAEYLCATCFNVLTKPHSCQQGHTFCHPCITSWLRTNKNCPSCRDPLSVQKLAYARPLETMIQKLQLKCLHHNVLQVEVMGNKETSSTAPPTKKTKKIPEEPVGCQWLGMLSERQKHLDEVCSFAEIKCTYSSCNKMIQRQDLPIHQKDCQYREVQCEFCHKALFAMQKKNHIDHLCTMFIIECPYGCEFKFVRAHKTTHELTCTHLPILCPMASVGCKVKLTRKDISEHILTSTVEHMELVGKRLAEHDSAITNSILETHFLEWTIPNISVIRTESPTFFDSKSVIIGSFRFSLRFGCRDPRFLKASVRIKSVDGVPQDLPGTISLEGSQITVIHPTDALRSINADFHERRLIVYGSGLACFTSGILFSVERCLADFMWPDGSLHIKAMIKIPRINKCYQV